MKRVSTQMVNLDMQHHLRLREWKMNDMQNKIASQSKISNLRDDPVAAAHSVRFKSHITMLEQFSSNVGTVKGSLQYTEGYMQEAVSILHRVREIAVAGAQGTFSKQDTEYMAEEVNQLLNELIRIGNAQSGDGRYLFAGTRNQSSAFREVRGHVPGGSGEVVTNVEYVGTIENTIAEISEGSYVSTGFSGNSVFWAENQILIAARDAGGYQLGTDSTIRVNGETIQLRAGDTVHAIIAKINDANVAVKASLDPVQNSLVLQTTKPMQLWLEDVGDGTVLQDLGVLSDTGYVPPNNIAEDARTTGGSMFDTIIQLRNNLYGGDQLEIGGRGIQGLDSAIDNLLTSLTGLGAENERLDLVEKRLASEIPETVKLDSLEVDLDMAEAITNLKMLEYTHKAALQTAGRILQPTLLDFLR